MAEDQIIIESKRPVGLFNESQPIVIAPTGPFVHRHSSTHQQVSYFVHSPEAPLDLKLAETAWHRAAFYVDMQENGLVRLQGLSESSPAWSCTVTGDSPPSCTSLPRGAEIFTSTGYVMNAQGIQACTDACFERMKQGLGRYYSRDHRFTGLCDLIANVTADSRTRMRALQRLAEMRAPESISFLLEHLDQEQDLAVKRAIILTLAGIYVGLVRLVPDVKGHESAIRERLAVLSQSLLPEIQAAAAQASAMIFTESETSAPASMTPAVIAPPRSYESIRAQLASSNPSLHLEAIAALGRRQERESVMILRQFLVGWREESRGGSDEGRQVVYQSALSALATLPFGEATDFLIDLLQKAKGGSEGAHDAAFAICTVPDFLQSADRIASLYRLRHTHPAEVGMIFRAWKISMETPVPPDVVVRYGPLPNPPGHPVTLEWLADEIDKILQERSHTHRNGGRQKAACTSIRDIVGLQGALYPLYLFLRGLENAELRDEIGRWLERDREDLLTEYGALFRHDNRGVRLVVFSPSRWGSNYSYYPSLAFNRVAGDNRILFKAHFHSLPHAERFAGPSGLGAVGHGDAWGSNQIVITRLGPGALNIDWFDHSYGAVDLGDYSYRVAN